jgi:predicted nicotinamide N-methyase
MRKTVLTILSASLIVVSATQIAGAAERQTHESDRARVHATEQFRNANDSLASPSVEQQDLSDYSEGHVISAPAGQ